MPTISPHGPAQPPRTQIAAHWHAAFLTMLPSIQRHADRAFCRLRVHDREEAVAAVLALALAAYVRLLELGKPELAYATVLAEYAVRQHRAGRRLGCRLNCRDVASPVCQRRRGFAVESRDAWRLALAEDRRTTPAELAAVRVDFEAWLATLTPRNRQLANVLATGETTTAVARMFRVTAGRISQLRRKLLESWRRFMGEAPLEGPHEDRRPGTCTALERLPTRRLAVAPICL